jgi:hypothetical protein
MSNTETYPEVSPDELGIVPPQAGPKAEWPKKIRNLTSQELDRLMIDADGRFYWDGKPVHNVEEQKIQNAEDTKPAQFGASQPFNAGSNAQQVGPVDEIERQAIEILDRAVIEIAEMRMVMPVQPTETKPQTADVQPHAEDADRLVNLDAVRPAQSLAAQAEPMHQELMQAETARVERALAEMTGTDHVQADPVREKELPAIRPNRELTPLQSALPSETVKLVPPMIRPAYSERMRLSLSFWQSLGALLATVSFLLAASGVAALGLVSAHEWGCKTGLVTQYCPPKPVPPPTPPVPPRIDIPG